MSSIKLEQLNDYEVAVLTYALESYYEEEREYTDIPNDDIKITLETLYSMFHEEYDKRNLHYSMFFAEVEDE